MSRDIFHQPRLLRAPSNPALSTAREGAATASLGNLGQCFTTLMGKNFLLISDLNLCSFSLQRGWLFLVALHAEMKSSTENAPQEWITYGNFCLFFRDSEEEGGIRRQSACTQPMWRKETGKPNLEISKR